MIANPLALHLTHSADTREKPFECPHCPLFFPRADVRDRHIRRLHVLDECGEDIGRDDLVNRAARGRSPARDLSHAKGQVVLESQARNTQALSARSCFPQVLLRHASPPSRSWQQMPFHRSTSVMQVRSNQAATSCHWHPLGQTYSSNHLMMIYSTSHTVIAPSLHHLTSLCVAPNA